MLCLPFWAIKLVSTTAAPFHIPISNVQEFQFLYNYVNTYYFLFVFSLFLFYSFCFSFCLVLVLVKAVLRGVEWYLFVVLICIFLMINSGEGNGTPLQYSCLENPMDGGAWWAAVHGVAKSQTRLSDFTFTFHFHALEKEMATHSSVLAWRIPGMGEPGGLPSMGSHRVGHDWSDLAWLIGASLVAQW